ncbi:uncharacterized protein F4822DRAFT_384412 [Hypoxylon trugodes]|uniref:uncharacterized protein n=1 Tax=Hypoxylon trugodes TaxID=326681 RepID=UPI002196B1D7|nr:uncharacterized protein F4822DRAFT_384412 [Hypoxylon trugodes]KAI1393361.1 hypothetical protein F4822DRAFT_384412 [Hypoxylon trugodes]
MDEGGSIICGLKWRCLLHFRIGVVMSYHGWRIGVLMYRPFSRLAGFDGHPWNFQLRVRFWWMDLVDILVILLVLFRITIIATLF